MKIVLNSDILYTTYLMQELPADIDELCKACERTHVPIVLPSTVILEAERNQTVQAKALLRKLEDSATLLKRYGVEVQGVAFTQLVKAPNLHDLMTATGATVEISEPSVEDFREAHRRACLHDPPAKEEAKSDEMRDIVIWMVALRAARASQKAILISRDVVHTGERGNEEAAEHNLMRVKTIGEALSLLETESPAARLAAQLLGEAAEALRTGGVPLAIPPQVQFVRDPRFAREAFGIAEAEFDVAATSESGGRIEGRVTITRCPVEGQISLVDLTVDGVTKDDVQLSFQIPEGVFQEEVSYEDRLRALRKTMRS